MDGPNLVCGQGAFRVEADWTWLGGDLCLCIGGGERPHIGAVALGIPRESLTGSGSSASASVLCVTGHKEDLLARQAALDLAAALECRVTVCLGLHVDRAGVAEIETLQAVFRQTLARVLERLLGERHRAPRPDSAVE